MVFDRLFVYMEYDGKFLGGWWWWGGGCHEKRLGLGQSFIYMKL